MWLERVLLVLLGLAGVQSMQVQMTEDLTKEEQALRTRWMGNHALKCEICHKMVDEVYVSAERAPGENKKVEEIHIVEAIEDICKFDGAGGAWLRSVKIVENDEDDFDIEPITGVIFRSNCDVSCQTIYRVCAKILEKEIDIDEFSNHMLRKGSKFKADELVCNPVCDKKKKKKDASSSSSSSKKQKKKSTKTANSKDSGEL